MSFNGIQDTELTSKYIDTSSKQRNVIGKSGMFNQVKNFLYWSTGG